MKLPPMRSDDGTVTPTAWDYFVSILTGLAVVWCLPESLPALGRFGAYMAVMFWSLELLDHMRHMRRSR